MTVLFQPWSLSASSIVISRPLWFNLETLVNTPRQIPKPTTHRCHCTNPRTFTHSLATWDADYQSPSPSCFSIILHLSFQFLDLNPIEFSFHILLATHGHGHALECFFFFLIKMSTFEISNANFPFLFALQFLPFQLTCSNCNSWTSSGLTAPWRQTFTALYVPHLYTYLFTFWYCLVCSSIPMILPLQ